MRSESDRTAAFQGDIERHGLGFARIAGDGIVIDKFGAALGWLPTRGHSCFEAPLLFGMDEAFRALRENPGEVIALPGVGLGDGGDKVGVTIVWNESEDCFSLAAAKSFGASETELMLLRERRERRLLDEQAEAERRRADISEALYRDIVESNIDFVLRLTPDRRIAFANRKLLGFCGAKLHGLVGRAVADALPAIEGAAWSAISDDRDVSFEQKCADATGATAWIWWRVAWLGTNGGPAEFQAIGRDVTLLRKLRADIDRANAEARSALVMRERMKIAHDLHDTIVHALVAVVAQLRLVRKMISRAPERVEAELQRAEEAARAGLERGREALGQVRFQRAGVDGLAAALTRAARRFEERTGVAVDLRLDQTVAAVAGETAEVLYRIVEEALRNVEAHAGASAVFLSARTVDEETEIEIADDGKGFDPAADYPGHYGLKGMIEQARIIGGRLTTSSRPGAGVRTTIRAPVRVEE